MCWQEVCGRVPSNRIIFFTHPLLTPTLTPTPTPTHTPTHASQEILYGNRHVVNPNSFDPQVRYGLSAATAAAGGNGDYNEDGEEEEEEEEEEEDEEEGIEEEEQVRRAAHARSPSHRNKSSNHNSPIAQNRIPSVHASPTASKGNSPIIATGVAAGSGGGDGGSSATSQQTPSMPMSAKQAFLYKLQQQEQEEKEREELESLRPMRLKQKQEALLAQQKRFYVEQQEIDEYGGVHASPSKQRQRQLEEEDRQHQLDLEMIADKEQEIREIQRLAAKKKEPAHGSPGSNQKFSPNNVPYLTHNLTQVISKPRELKPVPEPVKAYDSAPVESFSLREMLQQEKDLALQRQAAVHRGEKLSGPGEGAGEDGKGSPAKRGIPMPWDEGEDAILEEDEYKPGGSGSGSGSGSGRYNHGSNYDANGQDDAYLETQQRSPEGYVSSSIEEVTPAPMPEAFYNGVDEFLRSGPPPSLSVKGSKKKTDMIAATRGMKGVGAVGAGVLAGKRAAQNTSTNTTTTSSSSSSSSNNGVGSTSSNNGVGSTKVNKAKPKVNTNRTAGSNGTGGKGGAGANVGGKNGFDVDLLKEAFSYTEQLLKTSMQEEEQEAIVAARQSSNNASSGTGAVSNGRAGGIERPQYVDMGASGATRKPHPRSAPTNRDSGNHNSNNNNNAANFGFAPSGGGGARLGPSLAGSGNINSAATKRVGSNLVKKLRTQAAAYGGSGKSQSQTKKQADLLERRAQGGFDTSFGTTEKLSYATRSSVDDSNTGGGGFSTSGAASGGYGGLGNPDSATGLAAKNKVDYTALIQNFETGMYRDCDCVFLGVLCVLRRGGPNHRSDSILTVTPPSFSQLHSGDTLKSLRDELARSQASAARSTQFTRQAMMSANFDR